MTSVHAKRDTHDGPINAARDAYLRGDIDAYEFEDRVGALLGVQR